MSAANFSFDPAAFMATSYDQATSEVRLTLPDGYEGVCLISEVEAKLQKTKNGDKPVLNLKIEFTSPDMEVLVKRAKFVDIAQIWLDITESGTLDMSDGMNVDLGRLRAAVGQNKPGQAWNPANLIGQVVKVKHTLSKQEEGQDRRFSRYAFQKSL